MRTSLHYFLLIFLVMSIFRLSGQSPLKDTLLIDFGSSPSPAPWNNFNNPADGILPNLVNTHGYITNHGIMVIDSFNGINTAGSQVTETPISIPPTASGDSFFGNVALFGGQIQPEGALLLSDLDFNKEYKLSIFASRVATDNRETQYVISGALTDTVYLNPSVNTTEFATFATLPDASGQIQITVSPGPNNDNSSGFYYINALIVEYDHDPSIVPMDTVLLDLGNNISPLPWNNLTDPATGNLSKLLNTRGLMTQYGVMVSDSFNNINTGGTQMPDSTLGYPPNATGDSFFGNTSPFGGQTQPTGALDFVNLNKDKEYTFTIFASRTATDNREAMYTIIGNTTDTLFLDASDNTSEQVTSKVLPDSSGVIRIIAEPGPNNNNSSGFYYLGLVTMSYSFEDIEDPAPESDTLEIFVDFGGSPSALPWNNINDPVEGTITNLIDNRNDSTGYYLKVIDDFNNINTGGTQNPSEALNIPATASGDSFFGNVTEFGGQTQPTAGIEFGNLDIETLYEFAIFASRDASDNREAQYILEGASVDTVFLNASGNTSEVAISSLMPAEDGTIKIHISPGPNNNNASGFYYLGAIKLKYEPFMPPAPFDTLLIDFGSILSPEPWNNMTSTSSGNIEDLKKSNGFFSGYGIRVVDAFTGINDAGSQSPNPSTGIIPTASGDSFYGNTELWSGTIQETGGVEFYNLNPEKNYELAIFASRVATDNRETQYIIEGASIDTFYLQVSSNTDSLVMANITPSAEGLITVTASPGPNNNNSFGFFYLGAMKLIYEFEEPSTERELALIRPNGGESWQIGETAEIKWKSKNNPEIIIDYSTDGGTTWTNIDTLGSLSSTYNWTVPNEPSTECLVRLTSDTITVISSATFEISDDSDECHIVVLGSSTAEGTGASAGNSWVELYTDFLKYNTKFKVTNLGRGGYSTYHILPNGTEIPSGVGVSIDQSRNITAAVNLGASSIIVNMPSNDAASGYSVETQLANFETLYNYADDLGLNIFIATTQPRNFSNAEQIQIQLEVRDSILARYGDRAIDFWTGIANEQNTISTDVDSGDGVHLNDKGHNILFERVRDKMIDTADCSMVIINTKEVDNNDFNVLLFPNPNNGSMNIEFISDAASDVDVNLYNTLGQQIYSKRFYTSGNGKQIIEFESGISNKQNPGLYYCLIRISDGISITQKVIPVIVD